MARDLFKFGSRNILRKVCLSQNSNDRNDRNLTSPIASMSNFDQRTPRFGDRSGDRFQGEGPVAMAMAVELEKDFEHELQEAIPAGYVSSWNQL